MIYKIHEDKQIILSVQNYSLFLKQIIQAQVQWKQVICSTCKKKNFKNPNIYKGYKYSNKIWTPQSNDSDSFSCSLKDEC